MKWLGHSITRGTTGDGNQPYQVWPQLDKIVSNDSKGSILGDFQVDFNVLFFLPSFLGGEGKREMEMDGECALTVVLKCHF